MNIIPLRQNSHKLFRTLFLKVQPCSGILGKRVPFPNGEILGLNWNKCNLQHISSISTSSVNSNITSFNEKIKYNISIIKNVDLGQLKSAPLPATLYGFGGLIPFVFPPLYFIVGSYSPFLATAELVYGATILAFIGGVKWGNALAKDDISHEQIGISTLPSLVAWSSLLVPEPVGFLVVSSGLLGALYIDLVSSKYPPWFCAMRLTLTSVATLSLLTTFLFNILN